MFVGSVTFRWLGSVHAGSEGSDILRGGIMKNWWTGDGRIVGQGVEIFVRRGGIAKWSDVMVKRRNVLLVRV